MFYSRVINRPLAETIMNRVKPMQNGKAKGFLMSIAANINDSEGEMDISNIEYAISKIEDQKVREDVELVFYSCLCQIEE